MKKGKIPMKKRVLRIQILSLTAAVPLALATLPARADFTFTDGGKPAPAAELTKFFSGTTWQWPCKSCGAYFAPDGNITWIWNDKDGVQIGHGTWTAKEGAICWTTKVTKKSGVTDKGENCTAAKFGPGTDGKSKAKAALGLEKGDKSGFFWAWQDKMVWKEFKKGDQITATAAKLEAGLAKK